jgi:hypothetical protein
VDKLGKILETVVRRQPRSAALTGVQLKLALAAILGEELAAGCQAVELRQSTVWIATSNLALAQQLRSDSQEVLRRLNQGSYLPCRVRGLQVAERPPSGAPTGAPTGASRHLPPRGREGW